MKGYHGLSSTGLEKVEKLRLIRALIDTDPSLPAGSCIIYALPLFGERTTEFTRALITRLRLD